MQERDIYAGKWAKKEQSRRDESSRRPQTSVCMLVCQPVGSSSSDRRMDAYLLPQCRSRHGPGSVKHAALQNTNGDGDRRLNLYVSPQPGRAGPAGGRPAWLSRSQHPLDATTEDSYLSLLREGGERVCEKARRPGTRSRTGKRSISCRANTMATRIEKHPLTEDALATRDAGSTYYIRSQPLLAKPILELHLHTHYGRTHVSPTNGKTEHARHHQAGRQAHAGTPEQLSGTQKREKKEKKEEARGF